MENYLSSLPTVDRAAHSALLDRHTATDEQLAELATATAELDRKLIAIAAGVKNLMTTVEVIATYEETPLFRALRWLRLI